MRALNLVWLHIAPAGDVVWHRAGGVLVVACLHSAAMPVLAQDLAPGGLRSSRMLEEEIPRANRDTRPTFLTGERVTARPDLETVVDGDAMLRRGDMVIRADRLEYTDPEDRVRATGNVRINRTGDVYEGPLLELKVESFEGFFMSPRYQFLKGGGHGEAARVDFVDEQRAVVREATYTTCRREPGPSWMPAWILRASSISIDNEEEIGYAEGALLTFKGVPLLPVPALSFPLSSKRKTGVLPPTFGIDNVNGAEVTVPYYWDIAPNRDATLYPTVMSKRGVSLGGEFRYLETDYRGQAHASVLPNDQLRDSNRWSYDLLHTGTLRTGISGLGNLGVYLALNRVSDDNYWKDFTREGTTALTQRLLPNDLQLSWASGYLSTSLRMLKWQTLQDVTAPITPPYDQMPRLAAAYTRTDVAGFDYSVNVDTTHFQADRLRTLQPNARRSVAVAQVSRPWIAPFGFITPRMQLHATNYSFDTPLANGSTDASRVLPTFSVDSGLVFERDMQLFGTGFRQTLEPRAFYVYTPYRAQNQLPNYDSGVNDFNFSSIYAENGYVGNDRIVDANSLTVGLSTRLLNPDTGAEAARFGIAQRVNFKDQRVSLGGVVPAKKGASDLLVGATLNLDPRWTFDSTMQFNTDTGRSVRSTIGGRYSPGNYRVISAAYRLQRGLSEQIDVGWQWPINDLWGDKGSDLGPGRGQGSGRWYSVGRMNFSMRDSKLVDSVIGFEYDGDCWLGRIVVEKIQTGTSTANRRILFQLEFVGFARVGSNTLQSLKENIPRYQFLRENVTSPGRFSNYD